MILIDVNLLIYAVNKDAPLHHKAKAWLESVMSGNETICLPWIVILAFLRLTTRAGCFRVPLRVEGPLKLWMGGLRSLPSRLSSRRQSMARYCVIFLCRSGPAGI